MRHIFVTANTCLCWKLFWSSFSLDLKSKYFVQYQVICPDVTSLLQAIIKMGWRRIFMNVICKYLCRKSYHPVAEMWPSSDQTLSGFCCSLITLDTTVLTRIPNIKCPQPPWLHCLQRFSVKYFCLEATQIFSWKRTSRVCSPLPSTELHEVHFPNCYYCDQVCPENDRNPTL